MSVWDFLPFMQFRGPAPMEAFDLAQRQHMEMVQRMLDDVCDGVMDRNAIDGTCVEVPMPLLLNHESKR